MRPARAIETVISMHDGSREFDAPPTPITSDLAERFAAVTGDDVAACRVAPWTPPLVGAVAAWPCIDSAIDALVPGAARQLLVHGEHDLHYERPLTPGMVLESRARIISVRPMASNAAFTVEVASGDQGRLVVTQYVTLVLLGGVVQAAIEGHQPSHRFPEAARSRPGSVHRRRVARDQPLRFSEMSGLDAPVHVDRTAAKELGFPDIILQGLCTMAMCVQDVMTTLPEQERWPVRLAARFAGPLVTGRELVTTVHDAGRARGRRVSVFEATSEGELVVTDGRAESLGLRMASA